MFELKVNTVAGRLQLVMGLYHQPVLDADGNHVLDEHGEPMMRETGLITKEEAMRLLDLDDENQ